MKTSFLRLHPCRLRETSEGGEKEKAMGMKTFTVAAIVIVLTAVPVTVSFAQYPGEPKDPSGTYDPFGGMRYDREFGMPNETVHEAQKILQEQGYYHGPVDGVRNPQFVRALWKFQRAKGLPPTIHLDAQTLAALGVPATGAASPGSSSSSGFGASAAPSHSNAIEAP
jgi:peptidoglycan hydrolase-like protein with peptidoglycan-binding domain